MNVTNEDIVMLENAGHGLHFEHPMKIRKLIHSFLLQEIAEKQGGIDLTISSSLTEELKIESPDY